MVRESKNKRTWEHLDIDQESMWKNMDYENSIEPKMGNRRGAGAVIETDADGPRPKRARFEEDRPVALYILDLGNLVHHPQPNQWHWDLPEVEKLTVLFESSINELHIKFSEQLPNGRKVREIIGALQKRQRAPAPNRCHIRHHESARTTSWVPSYC